MSVRREWNPNTGVWYEETYDNTTDSIIVHTMQDVEPVLEWTKAQRDSGRHDKAGEFSLYAKIPATVEIQLKQKGIDINNKNHTKRIIQEIEQNYPHLKCTKLKHAVRS